jgi:Holliday junction resolvase RusA-like endonuclease
MCRNGHVYNPSTADAWKSAIIAGTIADITMVPLFPKGTPVEVWMAFWLPAPKNLKPGIVELVTVRPDIDNYAKAVLDALTNVGLWHDDSQVAVLHARKARETVGPIGMRLVVAEADFTHDFC